MFYRFALGWQQVFINSVLCTLLFLLMRYLNYFLTLTFIGEQEPVDNEWNPCMFATLVSTDWCWISRLSALKNINIRIWNQELWICLKPTARKKDVVRVSIFLPPALTSGLFLLARTRVKYAEEGSCWRKTTLAQVGDLVAGRTAPNSILASICTGYLMGWELGRQFHPFPLITQS